MLRSGDIRQVARQRIQLLFEQAEKVCKTNHSLTIKYVSTARKIAMSAKIRLPDKYKNQICKNCNMLLVQGYNCQVRIRQKREPHVVVTCLNCGHQTRILLKEKKEQKT